MYVSFPKSEVLGPLSRFLKTEEQPLLLGGGGVALAYTENPRYLILSRARALQHGNDNITTQNR